MIKIPKNFDGAKFAKKFDLDIDDFFAEYGYLRCPSLPDLTADDLLDCLVTPPSPAELQKSADIAAGVTDAAKLDALWELAINGNEKKLNALRAKIAKVALQRKSNST